MIDPRQRARGVSRHGRTDYRLARLATLRELREGMLNRQDVCDAHPDLVRAGANIGEEAGSPCPVCADAVALAYVTYGFYGRGAARSSGRALPRASLADLSKRYGDIAVYTVEVCHVCRWHHLVESYWVTRQRAV
jgi:hypothetical protein